MRAHPEHIICKEQATEAIKRSGYLLESRVESFLRSQDFSVAPNTLYPDSLTGKARELDLYASSHLQVECLKTNEYLGLLCTHILLECVNNSQPLAFIENKTREKDVDFCVSAELWTPKIIGRPAKIKIKEYDYEFDEDLSEFLGRINREYSPFKRLYTQYFSFAPKKTNNSSEWMASHEQAHFESFSKLCTVLDFQMNQTKDSLSLGLIREYFMLLVVQNQLWTVQESEKGDIEITDVDFVPFLISRNNHEENHYYQIDVVRESFLPKYIERLIQRRANQAELLQKYEVELKVAKLAESETTKLVT